MLAEALRILWIRRATLAIVAAVVLALMPARAATQIQTDAELKSAFLYNFAKFTDWPALHDDAPIIVCIAGDKGMATAFVDVVRGQKVGSHAFDVERSVAVNEWRRCHVLYIADGDIQKSTEGLVMIKTLPVLTVSDSKGFSQSSGVVELYVEGGRMRFAINVSAAARSGLHISARLLELAKIVRHDHGS